MLPASTVPGSVGPALRREPPFPGRFRPRPCGPGRSLRFLDPGISLFRFGFLRVPRPALRRLRFPGGSLVSRPCGFEFKFPYRTSDEASFFGVLSRFLRPGGFGFRRTLEGKWVRPWLAPPPRASSFRLPGPRFLRLPFFRTSAAFPRGRVWKLLSVSGRPLPATRGHWHRSVSRGKRPIGGRACG